MRVVIGGSENEANVRLAAGWRALGLEVEIGEIARIREEVRPDDTILARLDVLGTLDGVEPGLLDLLLLERRGARVLNTARALLRAHDKLRTAGVLQRAGLPRPRTEYICPRRPRPALAPPVVVKPRFGSWGSDVFRCYTSRDLARCLAATQKRPWFRRHGALVQELIASPGYDLRVLVAHGTVVGAVKRIAADGEWRTNVSLGGTREACVPDAYACSLAVRAAEAIGADLLGVDLLPLDHDFTVLEVNGAVDFDSMYSQPGRNVYQDLAAALQLTPSGNGSLTDRGGRKLALHSSGTMEQ